MPVRHQVWVDRGVQGVLVGRVILYWVCAVLYVGIGSACYQYNQYPEWTLAKHGMVLFEQIWPWLPTAILLLPLAVYDVVRLSNLFAGPVNRLRMHFRTLRNDIACAPLTFREDDYWRDLAAPINEMQEEILRLRSGVSALQKIASPASELIATLHADSPKKTESVLRQDASLDAPTDEPAAGEGNTAATATIPAPTGFEATLEAPNVVIV